MTTRSSRVMARASIDKKKPFKHYFDEHPTAEDLMAQSAIQALLIFYLLQVLEGITHAEPWLIVHDINIYRFPQRFEYPVAPDIAVFKGVVIDNIASHSLRSWRLYEYNRPAPSVVFEISCDSTWQDDLDIKPIKYAAMGVAEYFAYDPNDPPYWPAEQGRLRGWRLGGGNMIEQTKDQQGRLWSDELQSWLVADGAFLRLYDTVGHMRLTEAEAAQMLAATEQHAKEAAWAKLRELGIDPTKL
jgi:Uma2 family endonuclease